MNVHSLVERLSTLQSVLPLLAENVSPNDARWKPANGAWSVLEIVRHLVDEETDDFRIRLQQTMQNPNQAWQAIDPEAAAVQRRYNEGRLEDAVGDFVRERAASLQWLRPRLDEVASRANHAYAHPVFGEITVGDLLGSWVAHDQLHLRQIAKRFFQMTQRDAAPHSTDYAGDW